MHENVQTLKYHVQYYIQYNKLCTAFAIIQSTLLIKSPLFSIFFRWDTNGAELLVCTRNGGIKVFSMRESLLNCWTCIHSSTLAGERIVAAKWFHAGPKLVFGNSGGNTAAATDVSDRFSFSFAPFTPTLTGFGGSPRNGFVLVTATGLVKVYAVSPMGDHYEALEPISTKRRFRVVLASLACCKDGGMLLITSDGDPEMPVDCYHLAIKLETKNQIQKLLLVIKAMPSFFTTGFKFFTSSPQSTPASSAARISQLSFVDEDLNPQSPLTVLVGITGVGYRGLESSTLPTNRSMPPNQINTPTAVTRLECWELAKQMQQVHPIFRPLAAGKMMTQPQMVQHWRLNNFVVFPGTLRSVAPPKCSVFMTSTQDLPDSPPPCIALLFADGVLRMLDWRQWKQIKSTALSPLDTSNSGNGNNSFVTPNVTQTNLGCCVCVMDAGHLYVLRAYQLKEVTFSHVYWLASFFAYCLATGRDFWDVVMLVRPGLVESVLENLSASTPSANKLTSLSPKLLSLRECLYRSSGSSIGHAKAVDAYLKLYFSSLAACLKAMLRFRQDKSPSESLALVCASSTETELSKIVADIHHIEFVVETPNLLSMRQLLQWIGDFALFLVASLPLSQHSSVNHGGANAASTTSSSSSSSHGVSLVRDPAVLSALRELLLLIFLWGFLDAQAVPTFATSSKDACLPLLFKLVTKAWIAVKEGSPFEDVLLEECAMLQNQIAIPSADQLLPLGRNSLSPTSLPSGSTNAPFHYTFERDPSTGAAVGGHSGIVTQSSANSSASNSSSSSSSSQHPSCSFVPSLVTKTPHGSQVLVALSNHTINEQQRDLLHHT